MDNDGKKVRSDVNEDRLSGLPDELIHQILYRFDTKFAVQTCVLSSRWKLIWKSIPHLDFSSEHFKSLPKFDKFVTHVLTNRNRQVEVSSVKLLFRGVVSQVFVKKIANYAFSHNVQELTVINWPKIEPKNYQQYPPCLFSSQTLKHLSLVSRDYTPISCTPKIPWDFPALTSLHLYDIVLCDNDNESVDLFSKCLNLENLVIEYSIIRAKVFNISTPRLSTLKLSYCRESSVINVIAPHLENLTVINSSINNIKAPLRLSYLCYSGSFHPEWFKNCFHSLNEVSVNLSIYTENKPYVETAARETINMLQELRSARRLTLNMDIFECISSFPDLLSHLPSPFNNLISLNIINSNKRKAAYKVKLPTEARNFLLENSPSATFIMDLPEARILVCFREILDMVSQEINEDFTLFSKRAHIRSLLEALPKRQMTTMEARYTHQLEETETLRIRLRSMSEDLLSYVEQKVEAFEKYQSDNILTFQDPSSSAVIPTPSSPSVTCLGEILDMPSQETDEAFTFSSKMAQSCSYIPRLKYQPYAVNRPQPVTFKV
ncbi:F-box domain, cyclin-like protein [Artemisia annua]|uniref:F-box domain, cyclin-like protein n=1 Tax=Artemisia annua TaxID=35608 RepID=A0A2U1N2S4_ARTAN|nr:F-box domain, cyclin-like protein [Artemisia annua]